MDIPEKPNPGEVVIFGTAPNSITGSGVLVDPNQNVTAVNSITLNPSISNPGSSDTLWDNSGQLMFGPNPVGSIMLNPVGNNPNPEAASVSGVTLRLQPADSSNPGVVTTGIQTFAGAKTFSDELSIISASSPPSSIFFTAGGSPGTSAVLHFEQTTDSIYIVPDAPNGTEFVLSETNQTINGEKEFTEPVQTPAIQFTGPVTSPANNQLWNDAGVLKLGNDPVGQVSAGAIGSFSTSPYGLTVDNNTIYLQYATATDPGLVSTGNQSFKGVKYFENIVNTGQITTSYIGTNTISSPNGTATIKNITLNEVLAVKSSVQAAPAADQLWNDSGVLKFGTDPIGDISVTPVGSAPNANAASVAGNTLTLQPADSTNPGVVTTAAQTFAGKKTFGEIEATNITFPGLTPLNYYKEYDHVSTWSFGTGASQMTSGVTLKFVRVGCVVSVFIPSLNGPFTYNGSVHTPGSISLTGNVPAEFRPHTTVSFPMWAYDKNHAMGTFMISSATGSVTVYYKESSSTGYFGNQGNGTIGWQWARSITYLAPPI